MKKQLFTLLIIALPFCGFGQDIKQALFELPDVIFKRIKTPENYASAYELKIKQAIDHNNPDKGHFYQRVFLSHLGFDKPTVMVTNGYSKTQNSLTEVAQLLQANQLSVEHRYFGKSLPDSIDYSYLNLEQATADLHHIRELFDKIYSEKWISTGISKGGQTTLFYRYFYPEDVAVSIPYVAPINLSLEDPRIYEFLDTVGSDSCRAKIKAIQLRLLKDREQVLPLLRWYSYGAKLNFKYLNFEQAFEYQVLEYPFSFWQWGASCGKIPDANGSLDSVLYHLATISGLDFYADKSMKDFASHYYQAGSQMGYYGYNIEGLEPYLKALNTDKNPSAIFMPNHMQVPFNNEVVLKASEWLESKGDRIIYINGNADTWSATAIRPSKKVDARWFFLSGKDHAKARIKYMTPQERKELVEALEKWLEMDLTEESLPDSK